MSFQPVPADPPGPRRDRPGPAWDRPRRTALSTPEYEVRQLTLSRSVSRSAARQLLTDSAEHDGWELSRLSLFQDGTRRVTLRRRIIRARLTLDGLVSAG